MLDEKGILNRPFFMRDLVGISFLPELKKIGINSIKIEGRLKGVEYVYKVVSIYRRALELLEKNELHNKQIDAFISELKEVAFSRESTKGFFVIPKNLRETLNTAGGEAGIYVGKISGVYEKSIFFKTGIPLLVGDSLRILDVVTDKSYKLPIKAIYKNKIKEKEAKAGDYIGIPSNILGIKNGSKIFLTHRRFSFKSKIKVPDRVILPVIVKKTDDYLNRYRERFSMQKQYIRKINLTFHDDDCKYDINGRTFYFVLPDVYESEIERYEEIESDKNIYGVIISHLSEAEIFKNKEVYGSPYLYATNMAALKFYKKLGLKVLSKPVDLLDKDFKDIMFFNSTWIFWKNLPLWISRLKLDMTSYKFTKESKGYIKVNKTAGFFLKSS